MVILVATLSAPTKAENLPLKKTELPPRSNTIENNKLTMGLTTPLTSDESDDRSVQSESSHHIETGEGDVEEAYDPEDDDLAYRETMAVSLLRGTATTILLLASLLVSLGVHRTTARSERENFRSHYDEASSKMVDSLQSRLSSKLRALEALAMDIASLEKNPETSSQWPTVDLPDFQDRAKNTLAMAGASSLMFLPLVTEAQRATYESFAGSHLEWMETDTLLGLDSGLMATSRRLSSIPAHIFNLDGDVSGPGPYFPVWQTSPSNEHVAQWVNLDMLSVDKFAAGIKEVQSESKAVLDTVCNLADQEPTELSSSMDWFLDAVLDPADAYHAEPVSPLLYPVLDSSKNVAAILSALTYWRFALEHVLPANSHAIHVVFQNDCNQSFTYKVNGSEVTYLGEGDHHVSSLHAWGVAADLIDDVLSAYCPFHVSVYPTQEMRDAYITNLPFRYTMVAVLTFLFAFAVFVIYDVLVEHRQKVVMDRALQTTAIVSSLFPEQVRDRLFRSEDEDDEEAETVGADGVMMMEPAQNRLKSFLNHEGMDQNASKPIADLFPHCTVLFADISGFTAWSSLRDPPQVFILLESGTFDGLFPLLRLV